MQRDLAELESRRSVLESERLRSADALRAKLVSSETVDHDYRWGLRLRVGAISALLVLLALVFVRRAQVVPSGVAM